MTDRQQNTASRVKRKALAYITHHNRLLVFRHPDSPQAGIQVPGGTVGVNEDLDAAVLREAHEETGLTDLTIVGFLGEAFRAMDDFPGDFAPGEIHHGFFYHLRCGGEPLPSWRHYERFGSDDDADPIAFDFFWVALPDGVPKLFADQGLFIPQLLESLGRHEL
jgi:8-oxo-dGTP diphosphatase